MNGKHKHQSQTFASPITLAPALPYNALEAQAKELKLENYQLKEVVAQQKAKLADYDKLCAYIRALEKKESEWDKFPVQITEAQQEVLDILLSNEIGEQIYFQQQLRKLSSLPQPQIAGLIFQNNSLREGTKNFSFVTCSLQLSTWKPFSFERAHFTLETLWKQGLIHRILVTKPTQLICLPSERLVAVMTQLYEADYEAKYELRIMRIPPSYYPQHLNDVRMTIVVYPVKAAVQTYQALHMDRFIPETTVDMLDQINYYRSLLMTIQPNTRGIFLVAEDTRVKIYSTKRTETPFKQILNEFPEYTAYYNTIKAKYYLEKEGDTTKGDSEDSDDELVLSDDEHNDNDLQHLDEEALANIHQD